MFHYWYHWYMATPRGQRAVHEMREAFAQAMWDTWSPPGWYTPEEFAATAEAVEEAVIDAMLVNRTMVGRDGNRSAALPVEELLALLKKAGRLA